MLQEGQEVQSDAGCSQGPSVDLNNQTGTIPRTRSPTPSICPSQVTGLQAQMTLCDVTEMKSERMTLFNDLLKPVSSCKLLFIIGVPVAHPPI